MTDKEKEDNFKKDKPVLYWVTTQIITFVMFQVIIGLVTLSCVSLVAFFSWDISVYLNLTPWVVNLVLGCLFWLCFILSEQ